ncbi:MAG: signal peptide peptidase SppA [Syntrophobacteraceae bacterium CG23_combo_of_CG06-09_8_20_14_all_50_8]|nr:MAG: signal peptide peptidase SppA [Syntrophobacteraceae bacterium CG23_combo_of_CG06-09_8_20_14_all_50_8]
MRKHPIIYGISLVLFVGVIFLLVLHVLSVLRGEERSFSTGDKIGIVTISGIITNSQEIVEQLDAFGKDKAIKAVVLRIDSPGGGVAPSQEIYAAVKGLRKDKKVVASLGAIAASGGYMIACAADKIVANPGTITGSISAIMYFANAEDLLKKIGLKSSIIKSGKYKDIGSPIRKMTDDERKILQELVDDIYNQFLDVITKDRETSPEEIKRIADGRVFSGRQAQKLKLVDFLGDGSYAVRLAGKMAGISGTPDVVYPKKKGVTFWDYILQNTTTSIVAAIKSRTIPQGVNYLYEFGT